MSAQPDGVTMNPRFDAAYAAYEASCRALPIFSGPAATADASDAEDAAFEVMMEVEVEDGPRLALKLEAIFDRYDIGACGLPSTIEAAFLFEATEILRGSAPR